MSEATLIQSDRLDNHELKKFVDKTVELLKLSAVQGMNTAMNPRVYRFDPQSNALGASVAKVVGEHLKSLPTERLNSVRLSLGRNTSITNSIRAMGIDMYSEKAVIEQLDVKRIYSFMNEANFNETSINRTLSDISRFTTSDVVPVHESLRSELRDVGVRYGSILPATWLSDIEGFVAGGNFRVVNKNKKIKYRIHELKCIDETNPEWWGDDEISWGGATVDDKGVTGKIAEKYLGGGFSDGTTKSYNPPEIIKIFSLDDTYPKEFLVTMSLAEKDNGGMSAFIQKLYEAIKDDINKIMAALGAAAGTAIGAWIGGSIGSTVGGPLGTIIGAALGAILGALVQWLVDAFKDDIFPPQASIVFLRSGNDTFPGGSLVSPRATLHFRDHGGHYRITYDWEILR